MSRRTAAITGALLTFTLAILVPRLQAAQLGATDDTDSPLVVAQSSNRLGDLQIDGGLGDRGLNDGLGVDNGTFDRRGLGTFNSNRLGRMNGHGIGTMSGSGIGTMRGSGVGAMRGDGLGMPSGQGLGGLSGSAPSLTGNPAQSRNP